LIILPSQARDNKHKKKAFCCAAIYELHHGGMYSSAVGLPSGEIVSAFADGSARLGAVRWRPPPRQQVEKYLLRSTLVEKRGDQS